MPFRVVGTIQSIAGLTIEASDLALPLGSLCRISSFGGKTSSAEVIGFRQNRTLLMPLSSISAASHAATGLKTLQPPRGSGARDNCSAAYWTGLAGRSMARSRCG